MLDGHIITEKLEETAGKTSTIGLGRAATKTPARSHENEK